MEQVVSHCGRPFVGYHRSDSDIKGKSLGDTGRASLCYEAALQPTPQQKLYKSGQISVHFLSNMIHPVMKYLDMA